MVPSRALPPVPWGLAGEGRTEAYVKNSNSILTRRILQRAPDNQTTQQPHSHSRDLEADAVLAQWRHLTQERPQEEDDGYRARRKVPKAVKKVGAAFNPDRLLHPWQRDLNAMKNKKKNGGDSEDPYHHQPDSQRSSGELLGASIDYEYDAADSHNAARYQGSSPRYGYHDDEGDDDDAEDVGVFGAPPERNAHSADYYHAPSYGTHTDASVLGPPPQQQQRLQALSAGGNNNRKKKSTAMPAKVLGAKALPKGGVLPSLGMGVGAAGILLTPELGPRTGLEKLKSIDSAWAGGNNTDNNKNTGTGDDPGDQGDRRHKRDLQDAAAASPSSSGAFGSPLLDNQSKSGAALSAVSRVNNALRGGMSLSASLNSSSFRLGTSESIPEHGEGLDDDEDDGYSPKRQPVVRKDTVSKDAVARVGGNTTNSSSSSNNSAYGKPPSGRVASSAADHREESSDDDVGEDSDDDDNEEIGWSPFTVGTHT